MSFRKFYLVGLTVSPAPLAAALKLEFPEVDKTARMFVPYNDDKSLVQYFNSGQLVTSFYESKGYLADADFFDIFSYHFTEGNHITALQEPNTVVISQEMARKLFNNTSALDKVIRIKNSNGDIDFRITGVFTEKGKSHIDGRFFMSMKSGTYGQYAHTWTDFAVNNIFYIYIKLNPAPAKKYWKPNSLASSKSTKAKILKLPASLKNISCNV